MSLGDVNKAKTLAFEITVYSTIVNLALVSICFLVSSPLIDFIALDG